MPTSLKMDPPTPVDEMVRHRFLWLYFLVIWISFLPVTMFEYYFFKFLGVSLWMWFLLPWNMLGMYYITVIWSTYVAKFFVWSVSLFHKPREGVFSRSVTDKDYLHFHLRNLIRKFPIWLLYSLPFPWLKEGWLHRRFGSKIGKDCAIHDAFLNFEFIEIGNNVILGHGAAIISYWYEQDKFVLGRITIKDGAIIGSKASIMPYTTIGNNAIVDAESVVFARMEIKDGDFVSGKPVCSVKMKDVAFTE